jgi:predicted secreted protein
VIEYKLMKTDEMPFVDNNPKNQHFDPNIVKANALNILKFLRNKCIKEGGTYWIFKDTEKN